MRHDINRFAAKSSLLVADVAELPARLLADDTLLAAVLGIVEVVLEGRAPSGVVDVSIIVGTDLAPKEG